MIGAKSRGEELNFEAIKPRMDNETKYLWDELRLLQPTIDKFDDISFRIKN